MTIDTFYKYIEGNVDRGKALNAEMQINVYNKYIPK